MREGERRKRAEREGGRNHNSSLRACEKSASRQGAFVAAKCEMKMMAMASPPPPLNMAKLVVHQNDVGVGEVAFPRVRVHFIVLLLHFGEIRNICFLRPPLSPFPISVFTMASRREPRPQSLRSFGLIPKIFLSSEKEVLQGRFVPYVASRAIPTSLVVSEVNSVREGRCSTSKESDGLRPPRPLPPLSVRRRID